MMGGIRPIPKRWRNELPLPCRRDDPFLLVQVWFPGEGVASSPAWWRYASLVRIGENLKG